MNKPRWVLMIQNAEKLEAQAEKLEAQAAELRELAEGMRCGETDSGGAQCTRGPHRDKLHKIDVRYLP